MISLSIIIPCFKRVQQTLKTINLLLQSEGIDNRYKAEFIAADSSPDDELKLALQKEFGGKIIFTRPEKPGIATNKNQGAKIAQNPILIFCDSDMEVEKDTIKNTISALQRHKNAAAVGGQVIWRGGSKHGQHDRPRAEDRMLKIEQTTYVEVLYSRYIGTYKEVFLNVDGYDEVIFNMRGEGSDLSVRYWRAGYPLIYNEDIVVHHVYDAPDAVAVRVAHQEWAIAKDLFLLIYKYDILGQNYKNFIRTVAANFSPLGDMGYYEILQGLVQHYDFICKVKPYLDDQKSKMKSIYNFKFLEIFSRKELLNLCIKEAESRLLKIRKQSFHE